MIHDERRKSERKAETEEENVGCSKHICVRNFNQVDRVEILTQKKNKVFFAKQQEKEHIFVFHQTLINSVSISKIFGEKISRRKNDLIGHSGPTSKILDTASQLYVQTMSND